MSKFMSRKFLVALVTVLGALLQADADSLYLLVAGGAAVAYMVAEAFVDRGRLDAVIQAAKDGIEKGKSTLAVLLLVGLSASASGCGGAQNGADIARYTALGGAIAATTVDPILAMAYERATDRFEAGEMSRDDFEVALRRLDRADRALRSLTSALYAVDHAILAAEAGHECGLLPALDAAVSAARLVLDALVAAGLDPPEPLLQAAAMADALITAPKCEEARS